MLGKFSEALVLMWRHLGLFAALVLTVWLPGNLFLNYVNYYGVGVTEMSVIKLTVWTAALLDPICTAAIIYALYEIKMGRVAGYKESIGVGFKNWSTIFAARFIAGFLILLGLIALIVPGVVLSVRYLFLDVAVVVEDAGPVGSRRRSVELTEGRRWPIFWAVLVCFVVYFVVAVVVYLPLEYFDWLNQIWVEVTLDCLFDILLIVIEIVIFLFYWEAVEEQKMMQETMGDCLVEGDEGFVGS